MSSANLGEAVKLVSGKLEAAGIDTSRIDARLLVAHAAGVSPETILMHPESALDSKTMDQLAQLMERRVAREPMSHILGVREFWSMDFEVTPHTLTPRPDTECLVEAVLSALRENKDADDISILDLGTGSGCILLALLSELPGATGVGVDISLGALGVAQRNAERHGLASRVEFLEGSWFDTVQGQFDVIVSNPPYIESDEIDLLDPEVARYEPLSALDGGSDGLMFYREISSTAAEFLKTGGLIAVEVGINQHQHVGEILTKDGFLDVRTVRDLSGLERVVIATRPK